MHSKKPPEKKSESELTEEDFYFNEQGLLVLTEAFLLKRGYCCQNGCRHCPYEDQTTNPGNKK